MTNNANKIKSPNFWFDIALLILFFAPIYFLYLGNRPFATPDEARYVEIPREMLASGDWITPRLNGVKYFEKPPLLYWIEATLQYIFGLKEWAMRLPIVIFGLTGILATYAFGQRVFNRQTGLYAACILGSSCLYFVLSRLIILDMAVSLFVTLSLFCFYSAQQETKEKGRRIFYGLFTLFCALGVLTKGLMALAVPGVVIILWANYSKRWRSIFPAYIPSNFILFLIIVAPWHVLAALKNPEFVYKYFIVEHILRYSTTLHLRHQPIWFFIPIIFGGLFPWSAFSIPAFLKAFRDRYMHANAFLLIWIGFVFVFFSVSQSKLIPYILPLFPPMTLLLGNLIDEWLKKQTHAAAKWPLKHVHWLSFALGISAWLSDTYFPELNSDKAALKTYILALSACFFMMFLFSSHSSRISTLKTRLIGIFVSSLAILFVLIPASPHIQRPSLNTLVKTALSQRKSGDQIASYMAYFQDLPVYSSEVVIVVDATGELQFGTEVENTTSWMMSRKSFSEKLLDSTSSTWIFVRDHAVKNLENDNPKIMLRNVDCRNNVCLVEAKNYK